MCRATRLLRLLRRLRRLLASLQLQVRKVVEGSAMVGARSLRRVYGVHLQMRRRQRVLLMGLWHVRKRQTGQRFDRDSWMKHLGERRHFAAQAACKKRQLRVELRNLLPHTSHLSTEGCCIVSSTVCFGASAAVECVRRL